MKKNINEIIEHAKSVRERAEILDRQQPNLAPIVALCESRLLVEELIEGYTNLKEHAENEDDKASIKERLENLYAMLIAINKRLRIFE